MGISFLASLVMFVVIFAQAMPIFVHAGMRTEVVGATALFLVGYAAVFVWMCVQREGEHKKDSGFRWLLLFPPLCFQQICYIGYGCTPLRFGVDVFLPAYLGIVAFSAFNGSTTATAVFLAFELIASEIAVGVEASGWSCGEQASLLYSVEDPVTANTPCIRDTGQLLLWSNAAVTRILVFAIAVFGWAIQWYKSELARHLRAVKWLIREAAFNVHHNRPQRSFRSNEACDMQSLAHLLGAVEVVRPFVADTAFSFVAAGDLSAGDIPSSSHEPQMKKARTCDRGLMRELPNVAFDEGATSASTRGLLDDASSRLLLNQSLEHRRLPTLCEEQPALRASGQDTRKSASAALPSAQARVLASAEVACNDGVDPLPKQAASSESTTYLTHPALTETSACHSSAATTNSLEGIPLEASSMSGPSSRGSVGCMTTGSPVCSSYASSSASNALSASSQREGNRNNFHPGVLNWFRDLVSVTGRAFTEDRDGPLFACNEVPFSITDGTEPTQYTSDNYRVHQTHITMLGLALTSENARSLESMKRFITTVSSVAAKYRGSIMNIVSGHACISWRGPIHTRRSNVEAASSAALAVKRSNAQVAAAIVHKYTSAGHVRDETGRCVMYVVGSGLIEACSSYLQLSELLRCNVLVTPLVKTLLPNAVLCVPIDTIQHADEAVETLFDMIPDTVPPACLALYTEAFFCVWTDPEEATQQLSHLSLLKNIPDALKSHCARLRSQAMHKVRQPRKFGCNPFDVFASEEGKKRKPVRGDHRSGLSSPELPSNTPHAPVHSRRTNLPSSDTR
ncbi:hypothetical protein DIPPA_53117 [Diplonema papillatum]|nr:hypothetical protein DIPPA_53541 [Diplonema papillatum]KAJ9463066.1 hypothetical protein DIPPA_53117 [Diplonema papillatum]